MNQATDSANGSSWRTGSGQAAEKAQFGFLLLMLFSGFFSIAVSQIALGLALVAMLYRWFAGGGRPARTGMEIPVLLLTVWALLMIPFSSDPQQSLVFFRRFYLLAAVWVAASCATTERRRFLLLGVLAAGALAISLYSQIGPLTAGQSLFGVRFRGIFNAMTTGVLLMMPALLVFGFLAGASVGRRWKFVAALAGLSLSLGVAQTVTRSAILGLAFGLATILLLTRPRIFGTLLLAGLAAILLFQAQLLDLVPDRLEKRFRPTELLASKSTQARLEMYRGGWTMVRANPVTGVGDRDLLEIVPEYFGDQDTKYYGHLHSNPVQMAVIWGVPGFVFGSLFLLAPGWILLRRWRILWRDRNEGRALPVMNGWVLGAIGAWAGFNVAGLTEWYFGDAESMLIYLGLLGCALGSASCPADPVTDPVNGAEVPHA